jgi:hypothetical protein
MAGNAEQYCASYELAYRPVQPQLRPGTFSDHYENGNADSPDDAQPAQRPQNQRSALMPVVSVSGGKFHDVHVFSS